MAWLMLLIAGLFFFVWKRLSKTNKKWLPWFLAPLVLLVAASCLALSVAGQLFSWSVGGILGGISHLIPGGLVTGTLIAMVVLVVLIIGTFFDLIDKVPNKFAVMGLVLIPMFALIAIGPIASGIRGVTQDVGKVGTAAFSHVTGK